MRHLRGSTGHVLTFTSGCREYTSHTHVAGTPGDERLAQKLFDTWEAQGLDHVTKSTYDVGMGRLFKLQHMQGLREPGPS